MENSGEAEMSWMLGIIVELQAGKQKGNFGASLGGIRSDLEEMCVSYLGGWILSLRK